MPRTIAKAIAQHLVAHTCLMSLWVIIMISVLPMFWLAMNDALWRLGAGEVLTERPLAAIHHRVMGTIQEMDRTGERQSYLEGHLRAYPDAAEAIRASWQAELDQVNQRRRGIYLRILIIASVIYLPFGLIVDLIVRKSGPQDGLISEAT